MPTINVNGLSLCHKGSEGVSHNTLPDVCQTPPLAIPVPYENEAYSADLVKGTVSVFADGGNMIANMGSQFARSVFDEPGSMGGVISGTNRAETNWISHSFDVFIEGKPACRLTDKLFMNHGNTVNMAGLMQAHLPPLPELDATLSGSINNAKDAAGQGQPSSPASSEPKDNPPESPQSDDEQDTPHPMPCIVILIHGVNDIGEAYPNQDEGIVAGLKKRLNRHDLSAHQWSDYIMVHNPQAQKELSVPGRSPVIPFYWGYKPVTHEDYCADQKRYRKEVGELHDDAHLPYDAYQENNAHKLGALGNDGHSTLKFQNDNFSNVLDEQYAKGGGTFANATTTIPDMLGPGAGGAAIAVAGFMTLHANGGNFTHPIFNNPHRIYQFFAAQRLADLILTIRRNPAVKDDVINIVAHSQGTIITMLANMLVKQAGYNPANCVILNHSPYSLESTLMEGIQSGHHQSGPSRQKTLSNFCNLMATQYKGGEISQDELSTLEKAGTLREATDNPLRQDPRYRRNNNGKVYNYFCPNDGTVSLKNVQGMGWRGIPYHFAKELPNLYQRVFCQHVWVGTPAESKPFTLPPAWPGDAEYSSATNVSYTARDVLVNGEELPEVFAFRLQGQDNDPKYMADIDPDSPDASISYSAKAQAISRTSTGTFELDSWQSVHWRPGHVLTEEELAVESQKRGKTFVHGTVTGSKEFPDGKMNLTWQKSREELEEEWKNTEKVMYSQHSSIVMSEYAPSHAMAFDLAIGQCKSFDYQGGTFWEKLLRRADWRDPLNGNLDAQEYFRTGRLNLNETKIFMNNPDAVLPKDTFGVVNDYMHKYTIIPAQKNETHNRQRIEANLQWDMPDAKTDQELAQQGDQ